MVGVAAAVKPTWREALVRIVYPVLFLMPGIPDLPMTLVDQRWLFFLAFPLPRFLLFALLARNLPGQRRQVSMVDLGKIFLIEFIAMMFLTWIFGMNASQYFTLLLENALTYACMSLPTGLMAQLHGNGGSAIEQVLSFIYNKVSFLRKHFSLATPAEDEELKNALKEEEESIYSPEVRWRNPDLILIFSSLLLGSAQHLAGAGRWVYPHQTYMYGSETLALFDLISLVLMLKNLLAQRKSRG